MSTIVLGVIYLNCSVLQDNSSSNDEAVTAVTQAATANSLNKTPNCGTVKGRMGKDSPFSATLLSNSASDVIQVDLNGQDELTIKATPRNWDISLERINPANCEILDTENSFGTSGTEELKITSITGIQNAIRVRSGDQGGSGDYSLEGF
ncbi:MAG: hypothetical protein IT569_05455 [Leptospiraceae bacterium]|nr:hypothetical protein [Leptospiraceae bacterium]